MKGGRMKSTCLRSDQVTLAVCGHGQHFKNAFILHPSSFILSIAFILP